VAATETITFRLMREEDLEQVMAIENASYLTPWSRGAFVREIVENVTATYVVAIQDEAIVAYAGMWTLLDEGHITNIAVHPDHRRRGLGLATLCELARRGQRQGASRLTLEVRPSNTGAQELYRRAGFEVRGLRRRYYSDTGEDAVIMWLDDLRRLAAREATDDAAV